MIKKKPKLVVKQKKTNITKKPVIKKMSDKLSLDSIDNHLVNIIKDSINEVPSQEKIPLYNPQTGEPNKDYEELTGKKNPLLENKLDFKKGVFIAPVIEPKTENRFLVYLPSSFGLEPINISYLRLPSLRITNKKLFGLSYKKTLKYDYLEIEVREFIDTNFCNNILNIIKDNINFKFDFKVEMLSPTGNIIEEWNFTGSSINEIRFGELEYSSDKIRTIKLDIIPNDIKIFKLT
jgi:hypothetical protein